MDWPGLAPRLMAWRFLIAMYTFFHSFSPACLQGAANLPLFGAAALCGSPLIFSLYQTPIKRRHHAKKD
jgi:hypothetical protein